VGRERSGDTVGGKVQEASWSVLKPGGILVSIVGQPSAERAKACGARSASPVKFLEDWISAQHEQQLAA